jgi:hypothetical protein
MRLNFWRPSSLVVLCASLSYLALSASTPLLAEQEETASKAAVAVVSTTELPDAPGFAEERQTAQSSSSQSSTTPAGVKDPQTGQPQQTKRILGIMPNFSAVSADTKLPPQTPKQKFIIAAKNSFDYSSFVIAAIQSGINFSSESYPEFGEGVGGYGKYYYHTLLDTADENFMVSGLWPVVFRQDNRFYTMGHGGFKKRAFYAATRVLVTRTDNGNKTFNASEIVGSGAAAGLSTVYYPEEYRTWTKVGQKWLTSCIIDSANFTFKEFWPDINRKFFHTK